MVVHRNPAPAKAMVATVKAFLWPYLSEKLPPNQEPGNPARVATSPKVLTMDISAPMISLMVKLNMPPKGAVIFITVNDLKNMMRTAMITVLSVKVKAIASLVSDLSLTTSGSLMLRKRKAVSPVTPANVNMSL